MKCQKCGAEGKGKFCEFCGGALIEETANIQQNQQPIQPQNQTNQSNSGFVCPKCGSHNVTVVPITETSVASHTKGKTKGFGCIKACLGWIFFSIPGILCGFCGKGKTKSKTTTTTSTNIKMVKVCQNCGWRY